MGDEKGREAVEHAYGAYGLKSLQWYQDSGYSGAVLLIVETPILPQLKNAALRSTCGRAARKRGP